jgi:hypothetical protein
MSVRTSCNDACTFPASHRLNCQQAGATVAGILQSVPSNELSACTAGIAALGDDDHARALLKSGKVPGCSAQTSSKILAAAKKLPPADWHQLEDNDACQAAVMSEVAKVMANLTPSQVCSGPTAAALHAAPPAAAANVMWPQG